MGLEVVYQDNANIYKVIECNGLGEIIKLILTWWSNRKKDRKIILVLHAEIEEEIYPYFKLQRDELNTKVCLNFNYVAVIRQVPPKPCV